MLTFYDVPWKRNILHVGERSHRAVLRSRSDVKSVLRTVLLAHRIWQVRVREVRYAFG